MNWLKGLLGDRLNPTVETAKAKGGTEARQQKETKQTTSETEGKPAASPRFYKDGEYRIAEWLIGCDAEARQAACARGIRDGAVAFCTSGPSSGLSSGKFQGWFRCSHCHKDVDFAIAFSFTSEDRNQNVPCAQCGNTHLVGCRVERGTNPASGRPLLNVFVFVRPTAGEAKENAIYIESITAQ